MSTVDETRAGRSIRGPLLIGAGILVFAAAAAVLALRGAEREETAGAPLQSIPMFVGTPESELVPMETDLDGLPEPGSTAPDFVLADLDGNQVRLSDLRGQPVVLNFWATWCPPCRLEMPELQATQDDYAASGLRVLAINEGESAAQVQAFFAEGGITLHSLLDSDGDVGAAYGAVYLPSTVFINADGIVTAFHRGLISREQIDDYLSRTLPADAS